MDTKLIRLKTGEELITQFQEEDDQYRLVKPVVLKSIPMGQDENGQLQYKNMFFPWLELTQDEEFLIDKTEVLVVANLHPNVDAMYQRIYSNLILPPQKKLEIVGG